MKPVGPIEPVGPTEPVGPIGPVGAVEAVGAVGAVGVDRIPSLGGAADGVIGGEPAKACPPSVVIDGFGEGWSDLPGRGRLGGG